MNTPTKRIFYLFGPKFAKNEPQTKVWSSLTCKSQFSQPVVRAFAAFTLFTPVRADRATSAASLLPPPATGAPAGYLTPAFFLARSIAAICSSESLMEP